MDKISNVLKASGMFSGATVCTVAPLTPVAQPGPCLPDCPICGGQGWVRRDVDINDPNFGRLAPCPNLDPELLYGRFCGLDAATGEYKLDWSNIIDLGETIRVAREVRQAVDKGYGWIFLWGGFGQAKTLILKIATAVTIRSHKQASYTRMAEIIETLRQSYDQDRPFEEAQRRLDHYAEVPLLAIDEFDRVRNTEFANEQRFVLMDRRYESAVRRQTITLMAANTDPRNFDGYLADRIHDGRFAVIRINGVSARPYMED